MRMDQRGELCLTSSPLQRRSLSVHTTFYTVVAYKDKKLRSYSSFHIRDVTSVCVRLRPTGLFHT
jgi:hypothetical protein